MKLGHLICATHARALEQQHIDPKVDGRGLVCVTAVRWYAYRGLHCVDHRLINRDCWGAVRDWVARLCRRGKLELMDSA